MRHLILADIHANIDALEAINESFDCMLFLGDLVGYGPADFGRGYSVDSQGGS
jgi:hypothetical protein